MYHVDETVMTLDGLIEKVTSKFAYAEQVKQVVVVPLFASFPTYDFFVFHKTNVQGKLVWSPEVGYQCKYGDEQPDEDEKYTTWKKVKKSIWIGGLCKQYRVNPDTGARLSQKEKNGWILMARDTQVDMLGVSISEALPEQTADLNAPPCEKCAAEQSVLERQEEATQGTKRQKLV